MIGKYTKAAVSGVISGRIRSVFAVSGIAMGIFLVISLLSIGTGVKNQIMGQVETIGSDVIGVSSSTAGSDTVPGDSSDLLRGLSTPTLTLDDLQAVKKEPTITAAAPTRFLSGDVQFGGTSVTPTFLIATTNDYPAVRDLKMKEGRFFTSAELDSEPAKVVIGVPTAKALFGNDVALGKSITYNGQELQVIGVVQKTDTSPDTIATGNLDNVVYGPPSMIQDVSQQYLYSIIFAKAVSSSAAETAATHIQTSMSAYRAKNSFQVVTANERINTSQTILTVMTAFLFIIGIISLTISGIGIMNSMVVSVTDRTREIGVRKTVGATEMSIFIQFLFESLILTITGGLIGVALSYATVIVVKKFAPIQPELSAQFVVFGVALSVCVGVIFGVGPALSAARKEPIDALQTDRS